MIQASCLTAIPPSWRPAGGFFAAPLADIPSTSCRHKTARAQDSIVLGKEQILPFAREKAPVGHAAACSCLGYLSGAVRIAQHARHRTVWHSIAQSGGIKRAGSGEGQFFVRFGGHCACVLGGSDRSFLRAPGPPDTRYTLFPAGTRARAALSCCCPALPSCPRSRQTPALPGVLPDPVPVLSWSCPGLVRIGRARRQTVMPGSGPGHLRPSRDVPGTSGDVQRCPEMSGGSPAGRLAPLGACPRLPRAASLAVFRIPVPGTAQGPEVSPRALCRSRLFFPAQLPAFAGCVFLCSRTARASFSTLAMSPSTTMPLSSSCLGRKLYLSFTAI